MDSADFGCSCEHHRICGSQLDLDTLIRIKTITIERDPDKFEAILAAVWVSTGADRCIVGRLPGKYWDLRHHLEGRLAQVLQFFSNSESIDKHAYSVANKGVFSAVLVDRFVTGDEVINGYLSDIDSDVEGDEN